MHRSGWCVPRLADLKSLARARSAEGAHAALEGVKVILLYCQRNPAGDGLSDAAKVVAGIGRVFQ
jgi:hypothetical protein